MKALTVLRSFAKLPQCLAIVAIFGGLLPLAVRAQSDACPSSPALRKALWQRYRSPAEISVGLTDPILLPQTATWRIIDTKDGSSVPVTSVNYPLITGQHYALSALIVPERPLAIDHIYYLLVQGIVFEHCTTPPKTVSPAPVGMERNKEAKKDFALSAAKGRDDSDFYFAPTIDGASGQKASYTLDTKFQFRKSLLGPQFGKNAPYRPAIFFIPGWDLKVSSNPKQDGNSVNFLVPLEIVTPVAPASLSRLSKAVTGIVSQSGFAAEADKKFHDVNGVFGDYEYVLLHGFGGHYLWVSPQPTIGFEYGANLKAQSANTYPGSILRANFGMRAGFDIFQAKPNNKPLFSIDTDYTRRLLLHPEPTYTQDAKGNLQLQSIGTQPRDHVTVKISYNVASYVALTAAYEYGELPPVYTKVDNKYTFGVTFLGQLQYRPGSKVK